MCISVLNTLIFLTQNNVCVASDVLAKTTANATKPLCPGHVKYQTRISTVGWIWIFHLHTIRRVCWCFTVGREGQPNDTMSTTQNLSNDAILGLDVDLPIQDNYNYPDIGADLLEDDVSHTSKTLPRPKRLTDKLTPDLMTSSKGVPKIMKRAKTFKFEKRSKAKTSYDLNYKNVRYLNRDKFGEDHHFKNLTKVLEMYQSWGHDLSSHLKFDRFINNVFKSFEDPYMREWLRNETREEMRAKMEKETLREKRKLAKANSIANGTLNESTVLSQDDVNMDEQYAAYENEQNGAEIEDNNDHEEEWAEMFGGRNTTASNGDANENSHIFSGNNAEEEDAFEELNLSEIREKSHFSNYLRTSSQPMPFSSSQNGLSQDGNNDEGIEKGDDEERDEFDNIGGLQSILDDDEDDNEKQTENSQTANFSQYVAVGSQPEPKQDTPVDNSEEKTDEPAVDDSQLDSQTREDELDANISGISHINTTTNNDFSDNEDDDDFSDNDDVEAALLNL